MWEPTVFTYCRMQKCEGMFLSRSYSNSPPNTDMFALKEISVARIKICADGSLHELLPAVRQALVCTCPPVCLHLSSSPSSSCSATSRRECSAHGEYNLFLFIRGPAPWGNEGGEEERGTERKKEGFHAPKAGGRG